MSSGVKAAPRAARSSSLYGSLRMVLIVGISIVLGGVIKDHLNMLRDQTGPTRHASVTTPQERPSSPSEGAGLTTTPQEERPSSSEVSRLTTTPPEERPSSPSEGSSLLAEAKGLLRAAAAPAVPEEAAGQKTKTRPVVMIIADDLRPQLGHLGYNTVTPNIDRLAKESLVFERAYCNAPSCNPSRNSFISGVMPDVSKVYAFEGTTDEMGGDATTIFNHMRSHGFLAMGVGKLFHWQPIGLSFPYVEEGSGRVNRYFPQKYEQEWGCSPNEVNGGTCTPAMCEFGKEYAKDCKMGRVYLTDLPEARLFDHRVATEAHRLLGIASKVWHRQRKPSIVGIGFHHPHTKWVVPRALWEETLKIDVQPAKYHEPPKGVPDYAFGDINIAGDLILLDGSKVSNAEYWAKKPSQGIRRMPDHANVELRRGYSACITFMDKQLGRVLDSMDSLDLSNDTVVLFFSDHGYGLGEGGHWGKSALYEIDTRVPLIIRDPSIPQSQGRRTKVVVELIDMWKTIVDLGGLPYDNSGRDFYSRRDGRSLRSILEVVPNTNNFAWTRHTAITIMPKRSDGDTIPFGPGQKSYTWTPGTVVGYAARDNRYRYVAWMPFNKTLDAVDWSLAPVDEELYDHTKADQTFDDWDRVQLLDDRSSTSYGGYRVTANAMLTTLRSRGRSRVALAWGKFPWRRFDGDERFTHLTQRIYSEVGFKGDKYPK